MRVARPRPQTLRPTRIPPEYVSPGLYKRIQFVGQREPHTPPMRSHRETSVVLLGEPCLHLTRGQQELPSCFYHLQPVISPPTPSLSRHHVNPRQSLSRIFLKVNTDSQKADVRCSTPFQFHHKRLCGWSQPPRRLAELLRNDSARKEVTRAAMGDVDPTTVTTHIRAYWAKKKKVLDEIVLKDTLGEHSEA